MTKLSLVALLAISSAMAGGNIAPVVAPIVVAPVVKVKACNSNTTINSKATAYYMTSDIAPNKMFDKKNSQLGTAVTLDASHKFFDGLSANFSAVGFSNGISTGTYMEGAKTGAFFNVANITANFADTTVILGRQLIDSPMFGGFDWLLAPGAFNGYTLVNNSISNLTLVGTYVDRRRKNNSGVNFDKLAGSNYAFGAVYANENLFDASVWYYNVDAGANGGYKQVYADLGVSFSGAKVQGQYVTTNYANSTAADASAYGVKASYSIDSVGLYGAFAQIAKNSTGFIGVDSIYTSSWNTFASSVYKASDATTWKVGATADVYGISSELSYAKYGKNGSELDVILGYDATKTINLGLVYSSTKANAANSTATNALEFVTTYKF